VLGPEIFGARGGRISILALTLRFAVAIVLAVAAVGKARSFDDFRRTVDVTPWRRGVTAIAATVVAAEATLAVLLAAGVLPTAVAAAALALFLGFAAVSLWAARRGLQVQCNCFGSGDSELGKDSLATSLPLVGATLVYLALLLHAEPSPTLGELPVAATLGLAAVLGGRWLLAAPELAGIVRQRRRLDSDLAESGAR
jgi:uncharacterized membrane protein YphA (DoxX/SURF4 family)